MKPSDYFKDYEHYIELNTLCGCEKVYRTEDGKEPKERVIERCINTQILKNQGMPKSVHFTCRNFLYFDRVIDREQKKITWIFKEGL